MLLIKNITRQIKTEGLKIVIEVKRSIGEKYLCVTLKRLSEFITNHRKFYWKEMKNGKGIETQELLSRCIIFPRERGGSLSD